MSLIISLIIGGIVGWLASIVVKTNVQMGWIANVAVGVVGSMLGLLGCRLASRPQVASPASWSRSRARCC